MVSLQTALVSTDKFGEPFLLSWQEQGQPPVAERRSAVSDAAAADGQPLQEQEEMPDGSELSNHFPLTLHIQGDAPKQQELYERALHIKESIYGPDHHELVVPLTKLGNTWGRLGATERKRELLERALSIQQEILGPRHREVALIRFNLAHALYSLGDTTEALQQMKNSKTGFQASFGDKHGHTKAADRAVKYWEKLQNEARIEAGGLEKTASLLIQPFGKAQ